MRPVDDKIQLETLFPITSLSFHFDTTISSVYFSDRN